MLQAGFCLSAELIDNAMPRAWLEVSQILPAMRENLDCAFPPHLSARVCACSIRGLCAASIQPPPFLRPNMAEQHPTRVCGKLLCTGMAPWP